MAKTTPNSSDKLPKSKPRKRAANAKPARKNQGAQPAADDFPIVGMGASAGGLEALSAFFSKLPRERKSMAFVLVLHLDPSHASMIPDLLKRCTDMDVLEAHEGVAVNPDTVYVIPPRKDMAISGRVLRISEPAEPRGARMPIDFFLRSLAEDQGEKAICVILSGTGSDGTLGLRAVHGAGGMSMVQDPETAKYDGMPRSAIATGLADYVLAVESMPANLLAYVRQYYPKRPGEVLRIEGQTAVQLILAMLRVRTGHDFSHYKKTTILRRIERRMSVHQVTDPADYAQFIQEHPDEIRILFKELLIRVTSFFRDPEAFRTLREKILPDLFEKKPETYTLRVWVPGCGTGEEAYSIAMLLRE